MTLALPADADENHGGGGMVLGARGTFSYVDGGDADGDTFGLGIHGLAHAIHAEDGVTGKLYSDWHLGGGQGGVEGRLRGLLTMGIAPWDGDTPFLRLGLGGGVEGNDAFYFSHFELPVAEAGFHHSDDDFVIDFGPRASAMLVGQYDVGVARTRQLGTLPSWGGFASMIAGPIWLNATLMRIEDDTPVYSGWGQLCGGNYAAICIDGALFRGRVEPTVATTGYIGLTVGFGMGGPWSREIDLDEDEEEKEEKEEEAEPDEPE